MEIADFLELPYTYQVVKDDDAFVISVKELPGCITQGDSWEEAFTMIQDAMAG